MNGAPTGEIFTVELPERWVATGVCGSSGFPTTEERAEKGWETPRIPVPDIPKRPIGVYVKFGATPHDTWFSAYPLTHQTALAYTHPSKLRTPHDHCSFGI